MGRACTVCLHKDRDKIDVSLVAGDPYRNIAEQYGLSVGAISRHFQNHLPESLTKAVAVKEVAQADKLLARIEALITEAKRLLDFGKTKKEGRDWKAGLQELRKCFELLARVSGELDERPQINILALPQFGVILTRIREALGPFPEAQEAVTEAMRGLRDGNGDGK